MEACEGCSPRLHRQATRMARCQVLESRNGHYMEATCKTMSKDSTITWGFSMVVITNWRQWQRCKEGHERRTQTTRLGVTLERGLRFLA